jgi:hypothetical protein
MKTHTHPPTNQHTHTHNTHTQNTHANNLTNKGKVTFIANSAHKLNIHSVLQQKQGT